MTIRLIFLLASVASAQDLVLVNGKIITVDAKDSVAQAVAITNGKIVAVGTNEAARQAAAKDARVIDLQGRTATPGLIDTHCHFQEVDALLPFATYVRKGIIWGGGSDFSVTPFAARYGLWSSVERRTLHGVFGEQPFGTKESVDIHVALRSYTAWAARQLFLEDRIGSIEVGKDADLAVWDRDLYSVPAAALKDLKCQMTLVRGLVVYESAN